MTVMTYTLYCSTLWLTHCDCLLELLVISLSPLDSCWTFSRIAFQSLNTQSDDYMRLVQQHHTDLVSVSSEEKVKVVLDNQRNADMPVWLSPAYYKWVLRTNYDLYYSGAEPIVSSQKVPTESLAAELRLC